MIILGVDPGSNGALCALNPSTGATEFHPTPGDKQMVTCKQVADWIDGINSKNTVGVRLIGIEDVHAIYGTSAGSNFTFGYNVGVINAIAACSSISVDHVSPKVWQKIVGVPQKRPKLKGTALKKQIGGLAMKLYPNASLTGPKGGLLDGRADALLIAHHFALKYGII